MKTTPDEADLERLLKRYRLAEPSAGLKTRALAAAREVWQETSFDRSRRFTRAYPLLECAAALVILLTGWWLNAFLVESWQTFSAPAAPYFAQTDAAGDYAIVSDELSVLAARAAAMGRRDVQTHGLDQRKTLLRELLPDTLESPTPTRVTPHAGQNDCPTDKWT
jgi:hypothetical protein